MAERLEFEQNWVEHVELQKEQIIDQIASQLSREHPELFNGGFLSNSKRSEAEAFIRKAVLTRKDLSPQDADEVVSIIVGQSTGYGVLQEFFLPGAEDITEIFINPTTDGPKVFYSKHGRPWPATKQYFRNNDEVLRYCQKICDDAQRPFSEGSPIVDAWLKDGSRLAVVGFRASPLGVAATIRKSPTSRPPMPLEKLVEFEMLPPLAANTLVDLLVKGRANIGVFGRTDSGKTTFLRALGLHIDPMDRTFIAETSFEMYMPNLPNCINLVEVVYGNDIIVNMIMLCGLMNRNNPDRAIVSEIRSREIIAASQIASSTSGGFWTTGHAGDVNGLRTRLFGMFLDAGVQLPKDFLDEVIASMFHFVVFVDKETITPQRKRTLMSIVEITPNGYETIISFDRDEFASSGGKNRRWIYHKPVSKDMLSRLAFSGANIKPEYEKVQEKYLCCKAGGNI